MASSPQPCTGFHHKGCDLEGVKGAQISHTSLTQLTRIKPMNQLNTQVPVVELTDELLEQISAGFDVIAPEPGEPPEDDSWWIKRHLPGLHG